MPIPKLYNARCVSCGIDLALVGRVLDRCSDNVTCDERAARLPSPFDPEPRALEPAQNGYIWCDGCESVQPVTHVHPVWTEAEVAEAEKRGEELFWAFEGPVAAERAEFAESLLCAMAFDHGIERALMVAAFGEAGNDCGSESVLEPAVRCVFCVAARGGGR